ncbi:hypothetical protein HQ560_06775 [bacterium]|nr:hypothetical protein [bacterium]
MRLLLMSAILMAAAIALADEDPGRVPRVWGLKEEGEITATYAGREGDHIALRLKDGSTRKVHLWRVNAKDLAYLQRQQCGHFKAMRHAIPDQASSSIFLSTRSPSARCRRGRTTADSAGPSTR